VLKKEVPNNGKDDDNNGYVDDIHGWNFIGDTFEEQLEYVRLIASGQTNNPRYAQAKAKLEEEKNKTLANKTQYEQILQQVTASDAAIAKHLGKSVYTKEEVSAITTQDQALLQHKNIIIQTYGFGVGDITETKQELKDGVEHFTESLNYNLNVDFKGRKTTMVEA